MNSLLVLLDFFGLDVLRKEWDWKMDFRLLIFARLEKD
jgi:hypothetical protein